MPKKIVAVFGSGNAQPGQPIFELAYQLGKAIGQADFDLINGGYGGTMLATAKGAAETGARVIGITCQAFKRSGPNEFVTEEVSTKQLDQRLHELFDRSDAYIILPGGTGTLLELARAWELKNKRFLQSEKPVIIIGDFWQPLLKLVATQDAESTKLITVTKTPAQAIEILKKSFKENC